MDSINKVTVTSNPNNEPVSIDGVTSDLKCIGLGTDAAVFYCYNAPNFAFKKYAKGKTIKVTKEAEVYKNLGVSPYFSTCYASYEDFLVVSFEEGLTLFDCLLQGIHIPQQVIFDVENAREYARNKGLNPRDLHLKNILLQNGRAKIIDVSEYLEAENDFRWEYLRKGYDLYYPLFNGRKVPIWLVELIRKIYLQKR
ncbi:serine/threonine protein kinase [Ureibacillus manganicus]|uniref:serine/threonine protein kinase n=1 Tax=Ureibacillus manganicus TaxID=1266064 RepID=UPI00068CC310|nr:serine/threonine protein kinase [Ureibacillus manganicus]